MTREKMPENNSPELSREEKMWESRTRMLKSLARTELIKIGNVDGFAEINEIQIIKNDQVPTRTGQMAEEEFIKRYLPGYSEKIN